MLFVSVWINFHDSGHSSQDSQDLWIWRFIFNNLGIFLSDLLLHLDVPGLLKLVDSRAATGVAACGADHAVDEGDHGDHDGEDDTAQVVPHAKVGDS